jgi:hypothetical protein
MPGQLALASFVLDSLALAGMTPASAGSGSGAHTKRDITRVIGPPP